MSPKPPHEGPPHHDHEWIVNDTKERSLQQIGEKLEKIGKLLKERGAVQLGNNTVEPTDPCVFLMRYERLPEGELSLKLELEWNKQQDRTTSSSDDIEIS